MHRHLLPRRVPQPCGWRIAIHYSSTAWPGGDYYDFLQLPDGRLVLFVADTSDEGGPSAVLAAIVRVVMHSCPLNCGTERLPFCPLHGEVIQPPHVILGNLNRVLVENSLEEQHMTAFCGLLSPADGTLHYANAGHPPPRCWRDTSRQAEAVRDVMGLPLGVAATSTYHHKRIEIGPGDLLLCHSDGLTEAQNRAGATFGAERVDETLCELAPRGAEAVKDGLVTRLDGFTMGRPLEDDVTILVVERLKTEGGT
jgi:sigma-B regulation protein RsbU (phosphoserine phosphatase)